MSSILSCHYLFHYHYHHIFQRERGEARRQGLFVFILPQERYFIALMERHNVVDLLVCLIIFFYILYFECLFIHLFGNIETKRPP